METTQKPYQGGLSDEKWNALDPAIRELIIANRQLAVDAQAKVDNLMQTNLTQAAMASKNVIHILNENGQPNELFKRKAVGFVEKVIEEIPYHNKNRARTLRVTVCQKVFNRKATEVSEPFVNVGGTYLDERAGTLAPASGKRGGIGQTALTLDEAKAYIEAMVKAVQVIEPSYMADAQDEEEEEASEQEQ